jgi:hypothetical protein
LASFPLAFSAYQSTLRGLNRIVGTPAGMEQLRAGVPASLAYVVGFWLAIVFLILAFNQLRKLLVATAREHQEQPWPLALPGACVWALALPCSRAFFIFLPLLARHRRPDARGPAAGRRAAQRAVSPLCGETLALPEVRNRSCSVSAFCSPGSALLILSLRNRPHNPRQGGYFGGSFRSPSSPSPPPSAGSPGRPFRLPMPPPLEAETELAIWSHIVTISAGFVLLVLSWLIWRSASGATRTSALYCGSLPPPVLMIGAWVLIGEVPRAASSGDSRWWTVSFNTVWYSAGSIPFQFAISLMLATFLFQNIKGQGSLPDDLFPALHHADRGRRCRLPRHLLRPRVSTDE